MIPRTRDPKEPIHPGEILSEEFLKPEGLSQAELARKMGVPVQRINLLINGKRGMTAETAILLGEALRTSPKIWMDFQVAYDLRQAQKAMKRAG